jgi:hypothetical protein
MPFELNVICTTYQIGGRGLASVSSTRRFQMRKLILISALLLASASAQAGESRGLVLAANETPAVTDTAKPEPLKPETAAAPQAAQPQASKPAKKVHVRGHESDEAKARRIAARYGISW